MISISIAQKPALTKIYQLEHQLFGEHCYPEFFFRQAFDCWQQGLLIAEQTSNDASQLVGYVLAAPSFRAGEYWILSLAVDASVRGQGVGQALMTQVCANMAAGSVVQLTVDPANHAAVRLYQKLGFEVIAEENNYFGGQELRWVMQKLI